MSKKRKKSVKKPHMTAAEKKEWDLQERRRAKRMRPAARNLMLIALVFMAGGELLYQNHVVNYNTACLTTIAAAVCTGAALVVQFALVDRLRKKV